MPCSDGGPTIEEIENMQAAIRLACERCREIEASGATVPTWAQRWWNTHKRVDAERAQEEATMKKRDAIRRVALSKLTPKEREALGL